MVTINTLSTRKDEQVQGLEDTRRELRQLTTTVHAMQSNMQAIQDQLTSIQATSAALTTASMARTEEALRSSVQARKASNSAPPPCYSDSVQIGEASHQFQREAMPPRRDMMRSNLPQREYTDRVDHHHIAA